jgi:cysteine desulfurase
VTACFQQLQKEGFEVDIVDHLADGTVDLTALSELLRDDTILVSVVAVQSEIGFAQPLQQIGALVHSRSKAWFHTDATQALGKTELDLSEVDLASLTAHKIYGLKGIGALLQRDGISLEPQILGGHSTSVYRSGTPSAPMIDSLAYAVELACRELNVRRSIVFDRLERLVHGLKAIPGCVLNSTSACVPQIVNFSVPPIPARTLQENLSDQGILISTQSACRQDDQASLAVLRMWDSEERARQSVRVSLSHLTTTAQIDELLEALLRAVKA